MYNTSAAFKTAMAQPSRELTARGTITFPDATTHALTPTEISKFTITENAGDHLPLGGASASTLTLILDNRLGEWEPGGSILGAKSLDNAIIELEIGVDNSGYEYANAGVFVIENPVSQEQDAIITLKGSDYLANRALRAFSDSLTYPQTVLQIAQAACSQANIPLKTTVFVNSAVSIHEKPVWDENTTCRDVISYVACLAGGFARVDREGELEIISFANQAEGLYSQLLDSSFEIVDGELIWTYPAEYTGPAVTLVDSDLFIDEENIARLNDGEFQFIGTYDGTNYYVHPNRYKKLTNQGVMFGEFNALSVYEYGAPNGYGATRIADDIDIVDNELNSIAVRGNPLLAYGGAALTTLMTNMLNSLGGLEYYAASIEWQGDPSITCGDMVTISNLKGEAYNVLITNQTLTFGPGFSMVTGNRLNTAVVGKAKVENLRVFTPTGKLNAAALEGDINIRAGRQLNLLAGADIKVKSGANIDIEAGGKINVSATDLIISGETVETYASDKIRLEVSVGGTNLWTNTNFANGYSEWIKNIGTETLSLYGDSLVISIPQATSNAGVWRPIEGLEVGVPYTFSCVLAVDWPSLLYASTGAVVQVPWTGTSKKYSLTFTPASGTEYLYILGMISNDAPYTISANKLKVEKGTTATDWSPSPSDPASGVKTSYIDIATDHIDISTGGGVNVSSGADMTISAGGNFNLAAGTGKSGIGMSNDRPDNAFIWAGSDTPANAPFRVTMDGELTASSIGGGLVIPVANGGTGYNRQTIHRGTDYPSSGFGQDGDLFIFHNGQADSSWSAQTLTYGTGGQNTYFGVNRNWNQVPTAGFYRFGNGVGSSAYDFGAYAHFTAPAAVNSLTFTFVTAKYYNSTWYGYSGTTTYKVALVKASDMSVILASTTCYASQSQNTQTVTLTTAANMVQGDTYYIAVYFDGSDEKTNAGIVGDITMQAKVSNARTFDLLLKSAGNWYALFGNS